MLYTPKCLLCGTILFSDSTMLFYADVFQDDVLQVSGSKHRLSSNGRSPSVVLMKCWINPSVQPTVTDLRLDFFRSMWMIENPRQRKDHLTKQFHYFNTTCTTSRKMEISCTVMYLCSALREECAAK